MLIRRHAKKHSHMRLMAGGVWISHIDVVSRCATLGDSNIWTLILAELERRSHIEIGQILSCSANAVEKRIGRARTELPQKLAALLKEVS